VKNLPVRVRLLLRSVGSGREVVVRGIVNTGFMSDFPDIALPVSVAEELNLWPYPPSSTVIATFETGGGVVEGYIIPQSVIVKVITPDRESREVKVNVVVNPYIDEVLISDYLAEELGIQIIYPRRGIWKFTNEDKFRESE